MVMQEAESLLSEDLRCRMPLRVVQAEPYFGSFICIDLKDAAGEDLRLRIYLCDWKLHRKNEVVLTSNDDMADSKTIVDSLVGHLLVGIAEREIGCLELVFDREVSMLLRSNMDEYDEEDDLVLVYFPDFSWRYSPKHRFLKESKDSQHN